MTFYLQAVLQNFVLIFTHYIVSTIERTYRFMLVIIIVTLGMSYG